MAGLRKRYRSYITTLSSIVRCTRIWTNRSRRGCSRSRWGAIRPRTPWTFRPSNRCSDTNGWLSWPAVMNAWSVGTGSSTIAPSIECSPNAQLCHRGRGPRTRPVVSAGGNDHCGPIRTAARIPRGPFHRTPGRPFRGLSPPHSTTVAYAPGRCRGVRSVGRSVPRVGRRDVSECRHHRRCMCDRNTARGELVRSGRRDDPTGNGRAKRTRKEDARHCIGTFGTGFVPVCHRPRSCTRTDPRRRCVCRWADRYTGIYRTLIDFPTLGQVSNL